MNIYFDLCISYFTVRNCFVNHSLTYNNGQDEISLLAISLEKGIIYDCDIVNYRNRHMNEAKFKVLLRKMDDLRRELRIKTIVGTDFNQYKLERLVITNAFVNEENWLEKFKANNINLLFFSTLINELQQMNHRSLGYNNKIIDLLQIIN